MDDGRGGGDSRSFQFRARIGVGGDMPVVLLVEGVEDWREGSVDSEDTLAALGSKERMGNPSHSTAWPPPSCPGPPPSRRHQFPQSPRSLSSFSPTPSTKSMTGLSPLAFTTVTGSEKLSAISPRPDRLPLACSCHKHSIEWRCFFGHRSSSEGNTPQTCRHTPLGRDWLGRGFSTNAHTGTEPNISSQLDRVSTTSSHNLPVVYHLAPESRPRPGSWARPPTQLGAPARACACAWPRRPGPGRARGHGDVPAQPTPSATPKCPPAAPAATPAGTWSVETIIQAARRAITALVPRRRPRRAEMAGNGRGQPDPEHGWGRSQAGPPRHRAATATSSSSTSPQPRPAHGLARRTRVAVPAPHGQWRALATPAAITRPLALPPPFGTRRDTPGASGFALIPPAARIRDQAPRCPQLTP